MNDRCTDFIAGQTQAQFDYNLGYVAEFLSLHKAPSEVQEAFLEISRAFIAHKLQPWNNTVVCGCRACLNAAGEKIWWMVCCEECGFKRCPHATDHAYACTNSNEPGQEGSAYA